MLWTQKAQEYSPRFAAWAADLLVSSAEHWAILNSYRLAC